MSVPRKSRPGPTGPRTPSGKQKSSRNSVKHGIFVKNHAQDPEWKCLYRAIRREMTPPLDQCEQQLCHQLACNLVEAKRIDAYACDELNYASSRAFEGFERKIATHTMTLYRTDKSGELVIPVRPRQRLLSLTCLKAIVETHDDFKPDVLLERIDRVYGNQPTPTVELLKIVLSPGVGQPDLTEVKKKTLELLDQEIAVQKHLAHVERLLQDFYPLGAAALPDDAIMGKIARYKAANARHAALLISNFDAWSAFVAARRRRLKKRSKHTKHTK